MAGPRIVVVGSVNLDLVVTAPALPRPGETVLGHDFTQIPGGKGANQAIASARAGGATVLVGAIGSDAFGVTLRARLQASTVDTSLLRVRYGASGVALIVVDDEGENAIVVAPGANAALVDLTDAEMDAIAGADVLLCQLEVPVETVLAAALAGRAAGTRVVLNATPARALPAALLDAVDLLVVNRVEAATLTGLPEEDVDTGEAVDPSVILDTLLESVSRAVVTRSADGAWYGDRDGARVHVPAPVVEAVDTTGAGDGFIGALAVAWGEGRDLIDAVRWASAAGAAAVRGLGASNALPQRPDIEELYRATYGVGASG
jgi:ribokinase